MMILAVVSAVASLISLAQGNVNCSFDAGYCGWSNDASSDIAWRNRNRKTPSGGTGPNSDHTSGNGKFIYLEASIGSYGDKAKILSSSIPAGDYCFSFYYHMYGQDVYKFNIYQVDGQGSSEVFSRDFDYGNAWLPGSVDVSSAVGFQMQLEAVRGHSFQGDIAVDDVSIFPGPCPPPPPSQAGLNCDFINGICGWSYISKGNAVLRWQLQAGRTLSDYTGPDGDHTSGDGVYIHLEATGALQGQGAMIQSPSIPAGDHCFSFWYHMYGRDIYQLNVYQGEHTRLFHKEGQQGQQWIYAEVDVSDVASFKLKLEAVRGKDYRGDVSVDDVQIRSGKCSEQILVEVAAKPNAQAKVAHCALDYSANAAGSEKEFAPPGSVFPHGQNVSFGLPALGAGNIKNLRLKCASNQQDALQVAKLHVKHDNVWYAGDVNAVFDDANTCNVNEVEGINVCSEEKDVVLA